MSEDFSDLFQDDSTIPESNWFAFEKVGDNIQGELVMEPYDNETKFGKQRVYVVKTKEGKEFNVALKHTTHKYCVQQLRDVAVGDLVAFRLKDLIPTDYGNPAKAIEVRLKKLN
jgi:hypothetical protein